MKTIEFEHLFKNLKSIKLLRLKNVELILPFFYMTFNKEERSIKEETLIYRLEDYLSNEKLEEEEEDEYILEVEESKAKSYIRKWTNLGFLTNYENEEGDIIYELSSYSYKALNWIESQDNGEYIGTESKYKNIYKSIETLVENTNENIEDRIKILEKRKDDIQNQINELKRTQDVKVFDKEKVEITFKEILNVSRELLADFKDVESNFKKITHELFKQQTKLDLGKNEILQQAFNAIEELKTAPQGKSFYAFWDMLTDKTSQNDWVKLLEELYQALEEREISIEDNFLKDMHNHLYDYGKRVVNANIRMSEKLSRIIQERSENKTNATQKVVEEIKKVLVQGIPAEHQKEIGIELEGICTTLLLIENTINVAQKEEGYGKIKVKRSEKSTLAIENLASMIQRKNIDVKTIQKIFDKKRKEKGQFTLEEVLKEHKITKGLVEIVGFYQVAIEQESSTKKTEKFKTCINVDMQKYVEIPQIIIS